jgi:hypothetical protein
VFELCGPPRANLRREIAAILPSVLDAVLENRIVGERELDDFLTAALGEWVNKGSLPY